MDMTVGQDETLYVINDYGLSSSMPHNTHIIDFDVEKLRHLYQKKLWDLAIVPISLLPTGEIIYG